MYKRFIFRYYDVLIKTQRGDNERCVCVSQPWDLSVQDSGNWEIRFHV